MRRAPARNGGVPRAPYRLPSAATRGSAWPRSTGARGATALPQVASVDATISHAGGRSTHASRRLQRPKGAPSTPPAPWTSVPTSSARTRRDNVALTQRRRAAPPPRVHGDSKLPSFLTQHFPAVKSTVTRFVARLTFPQPFRNISRPGSIPHRFRVPMRLSAKDAWKRILDEAHREL